jgi:hypothetical protein
MRKYTIFLSIATLLGVGAAAQEQTGAGQMQTEIGTAEEFAALNDSQISLSGNYVLMNDLVLDNWTPIGIGEGDGKGFSGILDGNGHTVTIASFSDSPDNTRVGVFGTIAEGGVVKNLRVTGAIDYTGSQTILYIGGIAGINYGQIACCASAIALKAGIKNTTTKIIKGIAWYEDGAFGGGITGVNFGIITNSYSVGLVSLKGDRLLNYAGGIAGGNGRGIPGGIGIGVGSGGVSVGVTQGTAAINHVIENCYSTAEVFSEADMETVGSGLRKGASAAMSGGITASNHTTGAIIRSVSLCKTIQSSTKGKSGFSTAMPTASLGIAHYRHPLVFFSRDIILREYKGGQERKPRKFSDKKGAVSLSVTQEESWWRYPDGLTDKQRARTFGFAFGDDEQAPWAWDDEAKRPVLHWEKIY